MDDFSREASEIFNCSGELGWDRCGASVLVKVPGRFMCTAYSAPGTCSVKTGFCCTVVQGLGSVTSLLVGTVDAKGLRLDFFDSDNGAGLSVLPKATNALVQPMVRLMVDTNTTQCCKCKKRIESNHITVQCIHEFCTATSHHSCAGYKTRGVSRAKYLCEKHKTTKTSSRTKEKTFSEKTRQCEFNFASQRADR